MSYSSNTNFNICYLINNVICFHRPRRLRQKKLYISRYPANIARYKMLKHNKDKANPERFKYLYSGAKRMTKDGYNSLKYKRVDLLLKRLYTWILVDLPHLK